MKRSTGGTKNTRKKHFNIIALQLREKQDRERERERGINGLLTQTYDENHDSEQNECVAHIGNATLRLILIIRAGQANHSD